MDEDLIFAECYESGRRAARVGKFATANPHLSGEPTRMAAWVEGYSSVNDPSFPQEERAQIFSAGEAAASSGKTANFCPYSSDDDRERMEIWLMGYAPHVEMR